VLTFAAGFPRVAETVTAARAASRLGDPRFSQVFDVEDADQIAYVVLEWVVGESLLDMLSEGPLDPPRAAALVAEAARAIAAAHEGGLAHLRLDPACLHWTPGGGVKIAGLGIEAALADPVLTAAGDGSDDPELTDTRDLARLLYAALTGYWPGYWGSAEPGLLPPAPENDRGPCTPRQVSAGVPAGIDDVTCRALFQRPNRHGPALSTAAMFADALTSVTPPVPLPVPPASTPLGLTGTHGYSYQPDGAADPYPRDTYPPGTAPRPRANGGRKPPTERSAAARAVISMVIVLVLAAVGVTAWSISHSGHRAAAPTPTRPRPSSPAAVSAVLLKPTGASSFNPLGSPPGSNEDSGEVGNVLDGNASTFWHTSYYVGNPVFGGLKEGTGLLLDMGRPVRLSQIVVQFGTTCCVHAQIEIGNDNNPVASALSTFTVLQSSSTAQGDTTFNVTRNATGRYVLIWLTYLPPLNGSTDQFQAQIYDVVVRGSDASQSG